MVEVKNTHLFGSTWGCQRKIIPELFWSPMVAMVPTLETSAGSSIDGDWTVGGYFINIFQIHFHTYSIFPHISSIFQQSINHLPSTFTIHWNWSSHPKNAWLAGTVNHSPQAVTALWMSSCARTSATASFFLPEIPEVSIRFAVVKIR